MSKLNIDALVEVHRQMTGLEDYLAVAIPGKLVKGISAADTAEHLLRKYRAAMISAMNELGVPDTGDPAHVIKAYNLLAKALS